MQLRVELSYEIEQPSKPLSVTVFMVVETAAVPRVCDLVQMPGFIDDYLMDFHCEWRFCDGVLTPVIHQSCEPDSESELWESVNALLACGWLRA